MKPVLDILGQRAFRFGLDSLTVSQGEGMHDMFTAYLANPLIDELDDIKGQPCQLSWGQGFAAQDFYGYVDTVGDLDGRDGLGGLAVIGLGATSKMRSGQPRTWRKSTPFQIARSIVRPYRMSLLADRHVAPIDSFMQSSDSDWAALTRLSDHAGMTVVADGTTVRLIDVRRALGRAATSSVRLLTDPINFLKMETPSPAGFDSFDFNGVDALGANFTVRGGPEGGVRRHSGEHFASLGDAQIAKERRAARQRHYIKAAASYTGQRGVRCGDVVNAEGANWFVSSCVHEVVTASQHSTTHMELHRSPTARPVSAIIGRAPTPVLRSGTWASSKSYEVEL